MKEFVVALGIVAIVALLLTIQIPNTIICGGEAARLTKLGANGAALVKCWIRMTVDYELTPDAHVGWPGDLANRGGEGQINTTKEFYQRLVDYGHLTVADLQPLVHAPGLKSWDGTSIESLDPATMTAFKIYKVSAADPAGTVFLSSRNYRYNEPLLKDSVRASDKGFVVVNKDGHFSALKASQVKVLQQVGTLPGRKDVADRPHEQPADYFPMR